MATDAGMDLSQLLVWSGLVTFKQDQLTARFSLTGIEPRLLSEHSGLHLLSLVLGVGSRNRKLGPSGYLSVSRVSSRGVRKEQFQFLGILWGKSC